MILFITYNLRMPKKQYINLFKMLKSARSYTTVMKSSCLIETDEPVQAWEERILERINDNDTFVIIDITGNSLNGYLSQKTYDWVEKRQPVRRNNDLLISEGV
jgi:hypothetical protein